MKRLDGVEGQPGRREPICAADVLIEMCRGQPQRVLRASKAKTVELPEALECVKDASTKNNLRHTPHWSQTQQRTLSEAAIADN